MKLDDLKHLPDFGYEWDRKNSRPFEIAEISVENNPRRTTYVVGVLSTLGGGPYLISSDYLNKDGTLLDAEAKRLAHYTSYRTVERSRK